MKLGLISVVAALLFVGCCTNTPTHRSGQTNDPWSHVDLPTAVQEFDGSKNYLAYHTTLGIWQIDLPVTTNIWEVGSITVWVNTTGVEGRRKGNNVYCDQIQLVHDEKAHTLIASQYMFLQEMENSTVDTSKVTEGYANSGGDVFELKETNGLPFQLLRTNLAEAKLFIRLVSNQPVRQPFNVNSAKVQAKYR